MARRTARRDAEMEGRRSWQRDTGEFLFTAATNQTAPRVGDTGVRSLRTLVNRLGGKKAAAQELGVSVRTVQRWTAARPESRAKPGRTAASQIRDRQEQQRRERLAKVGTSKRAARMSTTGSTLRVKGKGGPNAGSPELSIKPRGDIPIDLTGDQTSQLFQSIARGDTNATMQLVNSFYDDHYLGRDDLQWTWQDVERLTLDDF